MKLKLDPKDISIKNREEVKNDVKKLKSKWIIPRMDVILVWDNDSAIVYAEMKKKIGKVLWIEIYFRAGCWSDYDRNVNQA